MPSTDINNILEKINGEIRDLELTSRGISGELIKRRKEKRKITREVVARLKKTPSRIRTVFN